MATNPGIEPVVSVEHGDAGDAIDYALGHLTSDFAKVDFLNHWQEGRLDHWPRYLEWVALQKRCAAKAKAARPSQPPVTDVERAIRQTLGCATHLDAGLVEDTVSAVIAAMQSGETR